MNNRQKTFADGICFSLHAVSIFSLLLLLLLSVNLLSAEFLWPQQTQTSSLSKLTAPRPTFWLSDRAQNVRRLRPRRHPWDQDRDRDRNVGFDASLVSRHFCYLLTMRSLVHRRLNWSLVCHGNAVTLVNDWCIREVHLHSIDRSHVSETTCLRQHYDYIDCLARVYQLAHPESCTWVRLGWIVFQ